MKTICFFSGDITRGGGTERTAIRLANALQEKNKDLRILFLSLTEGQRKPAFPISPHIRRSHLSDHWINPGPGYLSLIPKVRKYLRDKKVDVMIDIDVVLDVLSVPAARRLPVRVISWEHFDFSYEMGVFYRRLILKLYTKKTDAIVTLTKAGARSLSRYLGREKGIFTIGNPMPSIPQEIKEPKEKQLLTVGHLLAVKGSDLIVPMAKEVLSRFQDWTWVVVGEGELHEKLKTDAAEAGLSDRLLLTGEVQDVGPFYRKASIYVCPSRSEGLPMTILEAQAFRLPVVAFSMAGTEELVLDKINGRLLPMEDTKAMTEALCAVMEDESLRESYVSHALDRSEQFSEGRILAEWERIL
ncbi:MAG: glycosyltransferase family 4 protein [Lachnospiraceae bacterium]|nr:glycosyltransferase family 4 protein [Lachnospiraceae bacterium]